jgi:nicotinate phosphoribosyltransferase
MSIFDHQRLTDATFKLDVERMRMGWYTDKYFTNIAQMLSILAEQGYTYAGKAPHMPAGIAAQNVACGDLEVEMQWFTRRPGRTIVVGVDKALAMLRNSTGYFAGDEFINTSGQLEVWAVEDGCTVESDGDPLNISPVLRVRGRYTDFAILETPTLGILTRASRVATNVYETVVAARGKPVLFFPARFDVHEVQAADGYAYSIAVQRYNLDYARTLGPFVSTDAQGDWWGGYGGGTLWGAHGYQRQPARPLRAADGRSPVGPGGQPAAGVQRAAGAGYGLGALGAAGGLARARPPVLPRGQAGGIGWFFAGEDPQVRKTAGAGGYLCGRLGAV